MFLSYEIIGDLKMIFLDVTIYFKCFNNELILILISKEKKKQNNLASRTKHL